MKLIFGTIKVHIFSLLIRAFFLLTTWSFIFGSVEGYLVWLVVGAVVLFRSKQFKGSTYNSLMYIFLFLSIPVILLNTFEDFGVFVQFLFVFFSFSITATIPAYQNILKSLRDVLYFSAVALVLLSLAKGFDNFPYELPFSEIFNSSSNGVTTSLVVLNFYYQILTFKQSKRFDNLASLLVLVVALIGYGRGAILVSFIFLLIGLVNNVQRTSGVKGMALMVVVLSILTYSTYSYVEKFVVSNTKIGSGLADIERKAINEFYWSNISLFDVIKGRSFQGSIIENENRGNPHNSFIRIHNAFGMLGLILLFVIILIIFYQFKTLWDLSIIVLFTASFFIRIGTEIVHFGTVQDVYLFISLKHLIYGKNM